MERIRSITATLSGPSISQNWMAKRNGVWTTYKFIKNVYDIWMPAHFKRLCSAIDDIPADLDFSVPPLFQSFGFSQDIERHRLSEPTEHESLSREPSRQSISNTRDTTPNTSFTSQERRKSEGKGLLKDSSAEKYIYLISIL